MGFNGSLQFEVERRMEQLAIGVDGGGGRTNAVVMDATGEVVGRGESGPSNYHHVGLEAAGKAVGRAVEKALAEAGSSSAAAAFLCLSGAGRPEDRGVLLEFLRGRVPADRVEVDHDARAVLWAGTGGHPGVVVIAGTGILVWGENQEGQTARSDGWGSLLGDEGGGFWIGMEALRAALRGHDGRGPLTSLGAAIKEHFQVGRFEDLIPFIHDQPLPRDRVAAFATGVFEAARLGDAVAISVVDRAVGAVAASADAVLRRLFESESTAPVILAGGLFEERPLFRDPLATRIQSLRPGAQTRMCDRSPAEGAALLALNSLGIRLPMEPIGRGTVALEKPEVPPTGDHEVFQEIRRLLTEQRNPDTMDIDSVSIPEILNRINTEDSTIAAAVEKELPNVVKAVELVVESFRRGGRLFYVGAGTSGRLGVLDASECPPTFGTDPTMIQGIIAGGMATLVRSQEGVEDRTEDGARDLIARGVAAGDVVCGLAASRRTPYVLSALKKAREIGARTVFITCCPREEIGIEVDVAICPLVGPEVVMGSTRMKAGTAQKMVLNMITTASMIRLGKVYENMMVDLQMTSRKLVERSKRTVMTVTGISYDEATDLLAHAGGNVKTALVMHLAGVDRPEAEKALAASDGSVRKAVTRLSTG
jgi:N-acetylmuramic acid 6-phosphate etherase